MSKAITTQAGMRATACQGNEENVNHVIACCNSVGNHEVGSLISDGLNVGIPFLDIFKQLLALGLPMFIKWLTDLIAAKKAEHAA